MSAFASRPFRSPDTLWDFVFLGDVDVASVDPRVERSWGRALVPSAFDALPDLAGKRGAALYRTRFTTPGGRRARLEFGAVSMWCRVWVDGVALRDHACGYAPFTVDIPAAAGRREERELVLLVDNRYDFARSPMHEEYFDFYQYGGILRPVRIELPPPEGLFIDHVHVVPTADYADGEVELRVAFAGVSPGQFPQTVDLELAFDGASVASLGAVPLRDGLVRITARVPSPKLWSVEAPHLHRIALRLAGAEEWTHARFGLRRIEARDAKLWLNGRELKLRGYNRHEWHPNFGPCTPVGQMYADLLLLRDLGCNFVRGSHYPQDQRFLDFCDELGFLVWEENLGWGQHRAEVFASEKFLRDHRETLRAMVRASANHPSVIIWGFLNEAGTDTEHVRPCFEETVATLRALDPSRLVSYATMFPETDKYYGLIDLVSLNVYPGWYGCAGVERPLDLIEPTWQRLFDLIDARGFSAKPVIISETGVEALYGWRDTHADFFTEEYQAEYVRRACELAERHPRCSGIALWHFSDARTYGKGRSMQRPRTFNNKGSFDEYRRPKLAAAEVRRIFRGAGQREMGA